MSQYDDILLTSNDISLPLLRALGELSDRERECWVDRYVLGRGMANGGERSAIRRASEKLADLLGLEPPS